MRNEEPFLVVGFLLMELCEIFNWFFPFQDEYVFFKVAT